MTKWTRTARIIYIAVQLVSTSPLFALTDTLNTFPQTCHGVAIPEVEMCESDLLASQPSKSLTAWCVVYGTSANEVPGIGNVDNTSDREWLTQALGHQMAP